MKRPMRIFLPILASPALLLAVAGSALLSPLTVRPAVAQEAPAEEGAEVLTRGPVHEAFAETIVFKPTKGILISKAPPAVIEELPPDQRPDGDNVVWIPGYWAWDDEADDFLWVSGIWRNVPPGRQWIPGDWREVGSQYQWVSGYWGDAEADEVEYLPEPPASVEAGPNTPAPSDNSVWISGSWMWNDSRYRWRPGYWDAGYEDWDWVPAHYVWTPYGYVFVNGYWDYDVPRRGCIFAPVRFHRGFYDRPGYVYRPTIVVNLDVFSTHLFLRPRTRHYYFGDYYAPSYRKSGFYASHLYFAGRHGYDPIFAHQRWRHRDDDRWERRRDEDYRFFRDNREERPPHTLSALRDFIKRTDRARRDDAPIASNLAQFVASRKDSRMGFKAVNEDERKRFETRGREIRDFRKQYTKTLADSPVPKITERTDKKSKAGMAEPARVKIPRSPVAAKIAETATPNATPGSRDIPPRRPKVEVSSDKPGTNPGDPRDRGSRGRADNDHTDRPGRGPKTEPGNPPKVEPTDVPKRDPRTEPSDTPGRRPKVEPGDDRPGRTPKVDPADVPKRDRVEPGDTPGRRPKVDPSDAPGRNPRVDPGDQPKRTPKVEPADVPKRQPKVEPSERPKREPSVVPDNTPKREPRVEPKREPRVEPKREPRVEPKREPRVEPKREPRVEPKREPRVEHRPQPKAEPRPQPRVEPRPQPSRPAPQPKAERREQPKRGDDDGKKKDKRG
ncbi:MAG TPA: hypothetical protein VG796_23475 [Verrucomicrobiales bacterium]|nr:hypothetical protein [Verrucomicrobiales bacterium]